MKFNPNLFLAWLWILLGFVTGMVLGMFFHGENWLGGYGSFKRRMYRLGHISFFGLGAVNLLFCLTTQNLSPGRPGHRHRLVGLHRRRHHDAGLLRGHGAFPEGAPDFCRAGHQLDFGWRLALTLILHEPQSVTVTNAAVLLPTINHPANSP